MTQAGQKVAALKNQKAKTAEQLKAKETEMASISARLAKLHKTVRAAQGLQQDAHRLELARGERLREAQYAAEEARDRALQSEVASANAQRLKDLGLTEESADLAAAGVAPQNAEGFYARAIRAALPYVMLVFGMVAVGAGVFGTEFSDGAEFVLARFQIMLV